MPKRETIEAFIAMVEAGHFDTAMERFYAEDATMQENQDAPRKGLATLIEGDTVVIRWRFDFEFLDGRKIVLDEIAHQRWQGEKMQEEKFFYDPKQMSR